MKGTLNRIPPSLLPSFLASLRPRVRDTGIGIRPEIDRSDL